MDAHLRQIEQRIYGQPVWTLDGLAGRAYIATLHATHCPHGELYGLGPDAGRDDRATPIWAAVLALHRPSA